MRPQDTTAPTLTIGSPQDGFSTDLASITVSGTVSDTGSYASGVAQVTVNGTEATLNGGNWSLANVSLPGVGNNPITAIATDAAGNASTPVTINVIRQETADTTKPTVTISSPSDGSSTTEASITVSGNASDPGSPSSGVAHVKVNGVDASLNGGNWSLANVSLAFVGDNPITAIATDAAGNHSTPFTINVTRQNPRDTTAPVISISSPDNGFTTSNGTITVSGTAVDDGSVTTGIARVFVEGQQATYNPATHVWSATVPLNEGPNLIEAYAEDGATPLNRSNTATINVTRQTPPPSLTISNPQTGVVVASTSITVAGSVAADLPSSLAVTVNGVNTPISGGRFARTVELVEGPNTVTVVATNGQSQPTQSSITVIRDLTAPTISFANLPATVQPGGSYQVLVEASDNQGIADVEFSLNGQHVATASTAPYLFTLTVPLTYAAGVTLVLSAVARDLTNTTAVATAETHTAGPGGISGYAFDDSTGYVMPGVAALLNGDASVNTDEQGVFSLISAMPSGVVRLSKDGYTPVERLYKVAVGEGTAVFDSRLTPLDSHANVIGVGGGTASGDDGRVQVSFNAGTFASQTDVRVTSVSPQGLANLLPYGWSPVPGAVIDLRPASSAPYQSAAHLAISQVAGLTAATPLTLARYDEESHAWTVAAVGQLASANGGLTADLPRAGQYAYLVADTGVTAPPTPVVGQPLTSSQAADSTALDSAQATAASSPRTAAFSSTARSSISFFATAPAKLPSGVSIEATFGETYNLLGGKDPVLTDRPSQDFVLYAYPAATSDQPNRLGAFFIAKPTRTNFTITDLFSANVHVEIRSGRQSKLGSLIDNRGGSVRAGDGSELNIPANALSGSQAVFFNDIPAQAIGVLA